MTTKLARRGFLAGVVALALRDEAHARFDAAMRELAWHIRRMLPALERAAEALRGLADLVEQVAPFEWEPVDVEGIGEAVRAEMARRDG